MRLARVFILVCLLTLTSSAKEITIFWDIPQNSDIVGYFFVQESESGVSVRTNIGLCNKYTIDVLENRVYRFKLIPYDSKKVEGQVSNVIEYKYSPIIKEIKMPRPRIQVKD